MTKHLLRSKVEPFDPKKVKTVQDAFEALSHTSFQGRNLGKALDVMFQMVQEESCLKVLTLSGAMVPAGMEEIVCQLIEHHIIDAVVTTGANIIHSIVNSFDPTPEHQAHYIGAEGVDDAELYKHRINRIYDIFLPEEGYGYAEDGLLQIISEKFSPSIKHVLTPSELFEFLGEKLPGRGLLQVAYQNKTPIFCGATSDSELGLNLMKYRKRNDINITLDELKDIEYFANLIRKHEHYGTIIIGGGVPRNWAQQVFPYLDQMDQGTGGKQYNGYHYSIRFHTATQYDGGLSGCTISESISWGKYAKNATHQSVWVDATIGFPLIVTALFQKLGLI
ncbi:putative deoxyhypusine synthase [Candidatus Lokiarchaeum ossiferum]|uniref:Deoxyhypusine synthase n=1 Tax=Candidatus Lokiarchaeum ossiferum TaxID=2951803 RepID=A0ABY6HQJ6_9ARCH|nr:putative deoxyhypusine synthase [Candidatus Lokiarchaeum sp. B-35]